MDGSGSSGAATQVAPVQHATRRLIVRDSLTFLSLTASAVVLAAVTSFLFRSFESHREELAVRWAKRGSDALLAGKSAEAVSALRTALTYKPDDADDQLALAQALAAGGHTAEAENYFLNLWQARPGDGPINLQLARLERSRGAAAPAINYYRAAVFGTWPGDAPMRRRDTRLELSKYLIERGQMQSAQAELLVAASNNPDGATQLAIGELLEAARAPKDALAAYRNVGEDSGQQPVAHARAGELCYREGDYDCAERELHTALAWRGWTADQRKRMGAMQDDAGRLQQLAFGVDIPALARAEHLLNDAHIAQARLKQCAARQPPDTLSSMRAEWQKMKPSAPALRRDEDLQDATKQLMWQTEDAASAACGAPTGDDALLVWLRTHPVTKFGAE